MLHELVIYERKVDPTRKTPTKSYHGKGREERNGSLPTASVPFVV